MATVVDLLGPYANLILAMAAAGLFAGLMAGLFGVGGGIVTVPALFLVFQFLDVGEAAALKSAIGTSLAVIIVTSIRSLMAHRRAGYVDADLLRSWMPWVGLGAAIGGSLAKWAPAEALAIIFVAGAIPIAIKRLKGDAKPPTRAIDLHAKVLRLPLGIGVGVFSSLMGLGGGALGVMIMTAAGRPMHQAIGTSSGLGVAVAIPGATGFLIGGLGAGGLPPFSLGYVNILAFAIVALIAGLFAPIGAQLAHRLNPVTLSRTFGIYIFIAAAMIAFDVFIDK